MKNFDGAFGLLNFDNVLQIRHEFCAYFQVLLSDTFVLENVIVGYAHEKDIALNGMESDFTFILGDNGDGA